MGGKQSKLEIAKIKIAINDILTFLTEEVKTWDRDVKSMQESLKEGDVDWIPAYLSSQIENTEVRWNRMKAPYMKKVLPGYNVAPGNISGSEKDGTISTLKKNMAEKEEAFERQKSEMKQILNENFTEITQLKKQSQDLHKEKDELQRMFINNLKILRTEKEDCERRRKDAEEKFKIEKLKMREQGDVLMAEMQSLQIKVRELDKENNALLLRLRTEKEASEKHKKDAEERFKIDKFKMREQGEVLMAEKQSLETQVQELDMEKNALLLRLRKIAGDNLTATTDLFDFNRPTKLGEVYSELYDNEWTDAFEALKDAGHKEESAIETLRLTLEESVRFCENTVDKYCGKACDAMNLIFHEYVHSEEFQKLKPRLTEKEEKGADNFDMVPGRKRQASDKSCKTKTMAKAAICAMLPVAREEYDEANWTSGCIRELNPYLLKCLNIGWGMVLQSPPMVLHKCPGDQKIKFDKNLHKEYNSIGPVVSFVVWPALLLHEKGPVVCRGAAEGKKQNK